LVEAACEYARDCGTITVDSETGAREEFADDDRARLAARVGAAAAELTRRIGGRASA
jgi:hypothetical protein